LNIVIADFEDEVFRNLYFGMIGYYVANTEIQNLSNVNRKDLQTVKYYKYGSQSITSSLLVLALGIKICEEETMVIEE